MQTRELAITNRLGLHARACARIVQIASRFRCNVSLVVKGRRASARNGPCRIFEAPWSRTGLLVA